MGSLGTRSGFDRPGDVRPGVRWREVLRPDQSLLAGGREPAQKKPPPQGSDPVDRGAPRLTIRSSGRSIEDPDTYPIGWLAAMSMKVVRKIV